MKDLALQYVKNKKIITALKKERAKYNENNHCENPVYRYNDEPETCIDRFRVSKGYPIIFEDTFCDVCKVRHNNFLNLKKRTYENGALLRTIYKGLK
jgi:hypothetical protein